MKYVDLHVHTFYSDGLDSPYQVVRYAKMNGLDMLAIADHDNLSGYFKAISEAKKWDIKLIPAVELTTIESHILALNFDVSDEGFKKFVDYSREIQEGASMQRIEKLKRKNIPISFEKVKKAFPYSSIGKYTILWAMLLDDECRNYLEKNYTDLSFGGLFKVFLGTSGVAGNIEKRKVIHWNEAASEIKKAGGFVILPHPPKASRDPKNVLHLLKSADGIEVQPKFTKETQPYVDYAKEKNLFVTYGSDYHGMLGTSLILGKGNNQIEDRLAEILLKGK
jgi:predicted metal-dependent phosphoesterase TrpH